MSDVTKTTRYQGLTKTWYLSVCLPVLLLSLIYVFYIIFQIWENEPFIIVLWYSQVIMIFCVNSMVFRSFPWFSIRPWHLLLLCSITMHACAITTSLIRTTVFIYMWTFSSLWLVVFFSSRSTSYCSVATHNVG